MDYVLKDGDKLHIIEAQKNKIKEQIIDQYIAIRKERGLSQEKVSALSGIARTNIIRIEAKRNVPTIEILTKLAEAIDMELEIKFVEKNRRNDGK